MYVLERASKMNWSVQESLTPVRRRFLNFLTLLGKAMLSVTHVYFCMDLVLYKLSFLKKIPY